MIRSGWGNASMRRLLLVSAAAVIPVLGGCEAGNNAPTLNFHYPTDAAGTAVGDIAIRNVFVLGAPLGSSLAPGQSASLFFALVNSGAPDRLLSITAPGSAASVRLPVGGVPVPPQRAVLLTGPRPQAYLVDLSRTLTSGSDIALVLHFLRAGQVTLLVPVRARASHLVTLAPPPSPSATVPVTTHVSRKHNRASAAARPRATARPSLGVSPTPSPSAS